MNNILIAAGLTSTMIEYVIKPVVDLPSKYYPINSIIVGAVIGNKSDVLGLDLLIV